MPFPFEQDHTQVGGVKGSFNEDDDNQPITRNSPWKFKFPGWRVVILGSSGGIYLEGGKRG